MAKFEYPICHKVNRIRDALKRIIYLVCQIIRHDGCCGSVFFLDEALLLALVPKSHCSEVRKCLHHVRIIHVGCSCRHVP